MRKKIVLITDQPKREATEQEKAFFRAGHSYGITCGFCGTLSSLDSYQTGGKERYSCPSCKRVFERIKHPGRWIGDHYDPARLEIVEVNQIEMKIEGR